MKSLAKVSDVPVGTIRAFDASAAQPKALSKNRLPILRAVGIGKPQGVRIALANVGGTFHAIDDTCTHKGCSLGDGQLTDKVVRCACHGSRFDVTTGTVVGGPAETPVRSYPSQVVGDEVEVDY
jgi:3-phenylpropionate/trans-cinnamate dioxygenase ferredoxin component